MFRALNRQSDNRNSVDRQAVGGYLLVAVAVLYAVTLHGRTGLDVWNVWQESPATSHGMLIPLLVVYLVALRRRPDDPPMPIPSSVGVALMIVAEGLRHLADIDSDLFIRSLAAATASAAVIVLLIGPSASARSVGPILLLLLAVPLPTGFIEIVTAPLQGLATSAGTVLLVLIGQPAIEGEYTIYIGATSVLVDPECSGLSMVTGLMTVHAFVACSSTFRMRTKAFIIVLSVPMALVANVFRVAATALVIVYGSRPLAAKFHDAAGWLMMPFALACLYGVIALVDRLKRTEPAVAS